MGTSLLPGRTIDYGAEEGGACGSRRGDRARDTVVGCKIGAAVDEDGRGGEALGDSLQGTGDTGAEVGLGDAVPHGLEGEEMLQCTVAGLGVVGEIAMPVQSSGNDDCRTGGADHVFDDHDMDAGSGDVCQSLDLLNGATCGGQCP